MAKCFEEWTVLDNEPIEKLSDNLWTVSGLMKNGSTQRRMAVVRLSGRRLLVHNAIALDPEGMADLDEWGAPAYIVVPNGFHRQDAKIWKERYPSAKVLCPAGARAKVQSVVSVEGDYDEPLGDDAVQMFHWQGTKRREGALLVRSGEERTLITNDAVLNMPPASGVMGFMLAPSGSLSVPRVSRWMIVADGGKFRSHLEQLADDPSLTRIVVGHGATITDDATSHLRQAAARL